MDNFELLGTAAPGRPSAAAPLRRTPDSSLHGHVLASTPCDYPATFAGWLLQPNGELRLTVQTSNDNSGRLGNSDAGTGGSVDAFCMGVSPGPNGMFSTLSNVSLVSCGSPGALRYDEGTGRILANKLIATMPYGDPATAAGRLVPCCRARRLCANSMQLAAGSVQSIDRCSTARGGAVHCRVAAGPCWLS